MEYTKATAVDKEYPEAYLLRGSRYEDAGRYPEAKTDFEACLKLDPKLQNCRSSLDAVNDLIAQSQPHTLPTSADPTSGGPDWSGPGYYLMLPVLEKRHIQWGPFSSEADCEAARAESGDDSPEFCEYLATGPEYKRQLNAVPLPARRGTRSCA